jgi:hypothetical protein
MRFVAAAKAAVLAQLEPVGGVLFVFERVVVPALALGAGHRYHHAVFFFCHRSIREAPGAGHKENGAGPVPGRYDTTPLVTGTRALPGVVVRLSLGVPALLAPGFFLPGVSCEEANRA